MFVLGITGGIGCGKSTVSGYFRDHGVRVLDADEISRQVTNTGGVALPEIAELLGSRAINSQGALNREYVASLVFSEKKKLDKLSAIIHKYVLSTIAEEIVKEARLRRIEIRPRGAPCGVHPRAERVLRRRGSRLRRRLHRLRQGPGRGGAALAAGGGGQQDGDRQARRQQEGKSAHTGVRFLQI